MKRPAPFVYRRGAFYCYPPQQNMFQFWTNLTIDLYGGYFMTPNGNFTNGDMGENRGQMCIRDRTNDCKLARSSHPEYSL